MVEIRITGLFWYFFLTFIITLILSTFRRFFYGAVCKRVKFIGLPGIIYTMGTIKTLVNDGSVTEFIDSVEGDVKKKDSYVLLELFSKITGEKPKMWGTSIIGFGQYHYKSERSAQEGDWPLTGFSPRKQNLTLYIMPGFGDYTDLLKDLGKHKTSKGCLYINKLTDVDMVVLEKFIKKSYADTRKAYV